MSRHRHADLEAPGARDERDSLTSRRSSLDRKLIRTPPSRGRWRRFRQPWSPSNGRRPPDPTLPWRDLLDRSDALILDLRATRAGARVERLAVALVDTTGAARLAALSNPLNRPATAAGTAPAETRGLPGPTGKSPRYARALPWPEVHGHLVRVLESAAVVLAWDAPSKARLLAGTARSHGLALPATPWRDLRSDYGRLGYVDDSMAAAVKRHVAAGVMPGALAPCYRVLEVMRTCGH